jgi:hypothetical protein
MGREFWEGVSCLSPRVGTRNDALEYLTSIPILRKQSPTDLQLLPFGSDKNAHRRSRKAALEHEREVGRTLYRGRKPQMQMLRQTLLDHQPLHVTARLKHT